MCSCKSFIKIHMQFIDTEAVYIKITCNFYTQHVAFDWTATD